MSPCRKPSSSFSLFATLTVLLTVVACCSKQKTADAPVTTQGRGLYALPHVTVVAVTDWQAVLKPCGCTVDLQKGGIERIARYVEDLRKLDDSVLVVHAGSLLADEESFTSAAKRAQFQRRLQAFTQSLAQLDVGAVALSSFDLATGGDDARALYDQVQWPVLSAGWQNGVKRARSGVVHKTASGVTVGVLGIDPAAGDEAAQQKVVTAEAAALRQQGAQVLVVLSNLGLRGSRRLARTVPGLDVVVVGQLDEKIEPEFDLEREGQTLLVQAARHGAYFGTLTLVPQRAAGNRPEQAPLGPWVDAGAFLPGVVQDLEVRIAALQKNLAEWRAKASQPGQGALATQKALPFFERELATLQQRLAAAQGAAGKPLPPGRLAAYRAVGLPWSAPVSPLIEPIVSLYDTEVAAMNLKNAGDVPPVAAGEAGYVGQTVCIGCHQDTKNFVAQDPHQRAWATLTKVNKDKDLDCVACHVTGYGMPGGSVLGKLDRLTDVQCEACHGPGSLHAAAPGKAPGSKFQAVPKIDACVICHTPEHAPRFAFDDYRKRLLVPGHGLPLTKAP